MKRIDLLGVCLATIAGFVGIAFLKKSQPPEVTKTALQHLYVAPVEQVMAPQPASKTTEATFAELHQVALGLAQNDFEGALRFINENVPREKRSQAIMLLLQNTAKSDLAFLKYVMRLLPDPGERAFVLGIVSQYWVKRDSKAITDFAVSQLEGQAKNEALASLVGAFSIDSMFLDAQAVVNLMPFSSERSRTVNQLAANWARQDSSAAYSWVNSLPLKEERQKTLISMTSTLFLTKDIDGLKMFTVNAQDPFSSQIAARYIGMLQAETSAFADQKLFLQSLNDRDGQNYLSGAIERANASDLPKWGEEIASSNNPSPMAVVAYVTRIFDQNPEHAKEWALSQQGDIKESALRSLVTRWYDVDSLKLSEWVDSLSVGFESDLAREVIVQKLRGTDRPTARQVAQQIGNQAKRERALRAVR